MFLNRDGTLNRESVRDGRPFPPARLEDFELYPGTPEACTQLADAGFVLVLATNQTDVGRGTRDRFYEIGSPEGLAELDRKLRAEVE